MRWTRTLSTLALLLVVMAGCKQQCFIKECDYNHYRDNLAGHLEFEPQAADRPTSVVHTGGPDPTTILDPDRKPRYISLAEAISIALEQGTTGAQTAGGIGVDDLIRFRGNTPGPLGASSDHIRVLALTPATTYVDIEAALSKFDATYTSSMTWNTTDRPIGTALDAFQAGRQGALNAIQTDNAQFTSSLAKPLPTGGTAGITFNVPYQFTNLPARVNPAYTPSLTFGFEQPLLQGFGVEINQLRTAHPGSQLLRNLIPAAGAITGVGGFGGGANEGILLKVQRFDQARADFEASVNQMVLNVEVAYWNLYGAYWTLYSRELGLRLAYEFYRIINARYLAGGTQQTRLQDVARARGQYELFRSQRLQALGAVLEAERQLRKFLSLPASDDCRLVPLDTPTLAPYQPDWCTAKSEALVLRPELIIARENLKSVQKSLIQAKNDLMPDLRFFATYDINGIGTQLSGGGANNAFRSLADNQFNNYQFGVNLTVPIGYRLAHANVRRNRLEMARAYALLKDQELKTEQFLAQQYRRLFEFYEQIRAQRAQREAYGLQLRLEYERVRVGQITVADSTAILEAQRFYSEALANEYNTIVQYNNTLATFEFAKGTLMHHNNIMIGEGELPACAQAQASEHFRQRGHALLLKERAQPLHCGDCSKDLLALPQLPEHQAASLPALLDSAPKVPEGNPEHLPLPRREAELPGKPLPIGDEVKLPAGVTPTAPPAPPKTPEGPGGAPPTESKSGTTTPPARPEKFGASDQLPPSVNSRDSVPSLMNYLDTPSPR